jgi:GNAT superfamily N-acetyltransferase
VTITVRLLADLPELVGTVGELRFREWPADGDRDHWVAVTAREAGREELPVTWVAVDASGAAVGAVALGSSDVDPCPSVWGMVVREDMRHRGVGRLLLSRLERFAVGRGYTEIWVSTGGPAVAFYERCGWRGTDGHLMRKSI